MPPTKKKIIEREIIDDDESLDGEEIEYKEPTPKEDIKTKPKTKTIKRSPEEEQKIKENKSNRIKKANEIRLAKVDEARLEAKIKERLEIKSKKEEENKKLKESFERQVKEQVDKILKSKKSKPIKAMKKDIIDTEVRSDIESEEEVIQPKTKSKKPAPRQKVQKEKTPKQDDPLESLRLYKNLFM
jgi:hypothetical protein